MWVSIWSIPVRYKVLQWSPPTDASRFPYNDVERIMSPESQLMGFNVMTHAQEAYENSPVSKVTPDAPPFLLIHGTKDSTVPFSQSEELYDALEAAGCDVTLLALDGAEHADLMFFQDEVWQHEGDRPQVDGSYRRYGSARQGIGLQAYGQRDPLVEYKMVGFDMFDEMIAVCRRIPIRLFSIIGRAEGRA